MLTYSQNISNKEEFNLPAVLQVNEIDRLHINYLPHGGRKG